MEFQPDYNNILNVALNKRSDRLALYEHTISPLVMEKIMDVKFADLMEGNSSDVDEFFANYCRFFKEMTFDTVSFEMCITSILPDGGALLGGKAGPIQRRSDFDKYPWEQLPDMFWGRSEKLFDSMVKNMPEGMKAIGGVGNGVFEISEDLVGLEYLAYMQVDDPQLFDDLYTKIGELMCRIWSKFL
jgi:uroporphyrinogen decarboxylase